MKPRPADFCRQKDDPGIQSCDDTSVCGPPYVADKRGDKLFPGFKARRPGEVGVSMSFQLVLDSLPIGGFFLAFAAIALLTFESGYRQGRWRQKRSPDEVEGPTAMIVSSLLALMGFLLAISMAMAADRFDTRRGLVLAEANSVGTTFLRAGYLPEPAATDSRTLLREYVPLRIPAKSLEKIRPQIARSIEIHAQLWSIAEALARENPGSQVLALYIESLNQTIDLHETRVTAGIYARVPPAVFLLLLLGSMLTLGMVGYNAGLTQRRSPLTIVVLILVLGAVITLVADIDRGQDGLVVVNQQPLIDLQAQIDAPVKSGAGSSAR